MYSRTVAVSLSAILLAGCASQVEAPALPKDHPANPEAAEAPLPAPSQTLAPPSQPLAQGENPAPPLTTQPGQNAALSAPRMTPSTFPTTTQTAMKYTCPMHPEVISDQPGKCPKCGMKLVPAHTGDGGHR